jgi:hypothetical protein
VGARAVLECVLIAGGTLCLHACDILPRPGDTHGAQRWGEWDQHGRLVVDTDPRVTLVRMRVDTADTARHDVLLARFDFDPSEALGDEYELTLGLDLGDVRRLSADHPYAIDAAVRAYMTVTCLCRPLKPDSVRGSYTLQTRGMRQLAGRIDVVGYFTAWDDPSKHATYRLRQRIQGVRP